MRRGGRSSRRRRHRGRGLLRAVVVLALLVVLAGGAAWTLTPSVADAPQRVAATVAARGETSDAGVVPARVAAALVATEDAHFYTDHGVDPRAVARRAREVATGGIGGGAGLAQQLAKLVYGPDTTGARAEAEQLTLAVKLDHTFSRHRVLAMYLDEVYFGDQVSGVTDAARHYFGVRPDQLTWSQAAMLAGLVQAPTAYDPHLHLHLARVRERHVLDRLVATGVLSAAQADAAFRSPLDPAVTFAG